MAVRAGDRIDHDVIMGMGLVQMGPDDDLKIIAEQTPCKLTPDLMGLLRRHLAGGKGLNEVIAEDAARLFVFLFRFLHGSKGGFGRPAVQRGHKAHGIGFLRVSGVDDPLVQLGLFPIDGVLHAVVQPCADGEYLGVCHVTADPRCSRSFPAPP